MNIYSLVGFLLAAFVFIVGALTSSRNPTIFFDGHAVLVVVGGSIAAGSIAFQVDRMATMFAIFFRRVIKGKKTDYVQVIVELMKMADAYRTNSPLLQKMIQETKEPFLREAMEMFLDNVVNRDHVAKMLRTRVSTIFVRYTEDALKFKTVGKYPPAFGLMGTTLGMISLLQVLGQPGAQKLIGPSMSIALVATLYGITLSNLVFSPIAQNLLDSANEGKLRNTIILEGVLLIMDKTNPVILAEELNSYLLPSERIDWKKTNGASAGVKAA